LATEEQNAANESSSETWRAKPRAVPLPPRLTQEEAAAHDAFVKTMGDGALWNK
jgi:DNA polymerase-3 subunit epsilon